MIWKDELGRKNLVVRVGIPSADGNGALYRIGKVMAVEQHPEADRLLPERRIGQRIGEISTGDRQGPLLAPVAGVGARDLLLDGEALAIGLDRRRALPGNRQQAGELVVGIGQVLLRALLSNSRAMISFCTSVAPS